MPHPTLESILSQSRSASFLRLNIGATSGGYRPAHDAPVVIRIPNSQPQPDARKKPLAAHQDEKAGPRRARVCITRCGIRLLDADNLAGGVKFLVDALRYDNLIPQDDPASIELEVRQMKVPRKLTGTLVSITHYHDP